VNIARLPGVADEADVRPKAGTTQMVMHGPTGPAAMASVPAAVGGAVAENEDAATAAHRLLGSAKERIERRRQRRRPIAARKTASSVAGRIPGSSIARSPAKRLVIEHGMLEPKLARVLGLLVEQVACGPRKTPSDITSCSRIGSIAGFVTCAKSCGKYAKRSCGRSDKTASGASLPIDPIASSPVSPIGARTMRSSSRV